MILGAFKLFLWLELIGFDNTRSDFGVAEYLSRMDVKPQVISLLLHEESLFLTHQEGSVKDFALTAFNCSYAGRPFNPERKRQQWTSVQLKGLVSELKKAGVEVFASFFATESYPVQQSRAEMVSKKLAAFLRDYGFDGLHGSDGYAPPRFILPESSGTNRVRIARQYARQYADNWRAFVGELKKSGLKCWLNTCWTRDPYEALYRYGVDYRLLAELGIDGFVVESSAAAQTIEGWNYCKSAPLDRSVAMLMRLKACCPNTPMVMLHGINDGTEQWSALRHAPTLAKSECLAMGSVFYGRRRAIDGYLACLADGVAKDEWRTLDRLWALSFAQAAGPVGMRVVWSDKAFDREFDALVVSQDASSNTLLSELIRCGAPINASISVEDALNDKSIPLLILNPEFFPQEEREALHDRLAKVVEFGRGAMGPYHEPYAAIPEGTPPFPGMPANTSCYWKRPIPENMPTETSLRRMADVVAWPSSPFTAETPGLRVCGYRLANGRLAVVARNEGDVYLNASIGFDPMTMAISNVRVHSDFPSLPLKTVLQGRIAPHDAMLFSVESGEIIPSAAPLE